MWRVVARYYGNTENVRLTNGDDIVIVKWRVGSHTANVYDMSALGYGGEGKEIDCFTFAWAKDEATSADFADALNSWMDYADTVEVW